MGRSGVTETGPGEKFDGAERFSDSRECVSRRPCKKMVENEIGGV